MCDISPLTYKMSLFSAALKVTATLPKMTDWVKQVTIY